MNYAFLDAYIEDLKLISESQLNDSENNKFNSIDELTEENIITIAEGYEDCDGCDGWDESTINTLSPILDKIDSFIYEIKNCKKGSFTGVNNINDLKNYINKLSEELIDVSENL